MEAIKKGSTKKGSAKMRAGKKVVLTLLLTIAMFFGGICVPRVTESGVITAQAGTKKSDAELKKMYKKYLVQQYKDRGEEIQIRKIVLQKIDGLSNKVGIIKYKSNDESEFEYSYVAYSAALFNHLFDEDHYDYGGVDSVLEWRGKTYLASASIKNTKKGYKGYIGFCTYKTSKKDGKKVVNISYGALQSPGDTYKYEQDYYIGRNIDSKKINKSQWNAACKGLVPVEDLFKKKSK
jgi:adenine-specific DNA methylase